MIIEIDETDLTTHQRKMLIEIWGLVDQIRKRHFLNVHFRAFQLSHDAWKEHIRVNAMSAASSMPGQPPEGALVEP